MAGTTFGRTPMLTTRARRCFAAGGSPGHPRFARDPLRRATRRLSALGFTLELFPDLSDVSRDGVGVCAFRLPQTFARDPRHVARERCEAALFGMRGDSGKLKNLGSDLRIEFRLHDVGAATL